MTSNCFYQEINRRFFWGQSFEFIELLQGFMVSLAGEQYGGLFELAEWVLRPRVDGKLQSRKRPIRLLQGVLDLRSQKDDMD